MSTNSESTMSVTELQKHIKDCVVPCLMDAGLMNMETVQVDNYKWVVALEVEGERRFAELSLSAKKADFTDDDLDRAVKAFAEKQAKAADREATRASKRAEKAAEKAAKAAAKAEQE